MARTHARRRAAALLVVAVVVGVAAALLLLHHGSSKTDPSGGPLDPGTAPGQRDDPLRYQRSRQAAFESAAADGLAHVLFAKSPGGAIATAQRVNALRPQIAKAAGNGAVVDADTLEALVFLESGGRPDAQASNDLNGAVGLTQILAQTATGFLGMKVDVAQSTKLTRGIARGHKVAAREKQRRKVDERFDPAKALAATVKYLQTAEAKLGGRKDLAVESYHMGIGNLSSALADYGGGTIPYAQLYFDSTPLRHSRAYARMAALGDDSATYYWRILAAKKIMRQFRDDPQALDTENTLQLQKNSAENLLHPPATTAAFADPFALGRARASGQLLALPTIRLAADGIRVDPQMGELASKLKQSPGLYRALRPAALGTAEYIGNAVQAIAGRGASLLMTSSARDDQYQKLLIGTNIEATKGFSLHTTGFAFDIARTYASKQQALAFQFVLDRLTALNIIAWVREPGAIHVTAGPRANLLPVSR